MNEIILPHECDFVMGLDSMDPEKAFCIKCGKGIMDDYVPPEPEPEKPLEFIKYRSIHNTHRDAVIERVRQEGFDRFSWIALNKYHGTNFSLLASAEEIYACTKEGKIPKSHNHSGHLSMMPYLSKIVREMQSYFGKNIQVYFELFGGTYPHPQVMPDKRFKRVMKGVFYCPSIDVRVIDIKVDGVFLDWDHMEEITKRYNLFPAKVLHRGSFKDMMDLDPQFLDTTYKDYNLPEIKDNFSEGYVLRPTKECEFKNGRRVALKKKSKKFKEKANKARKVKTKVIMNQLEQESLDNLVSCITEARVNNIISHGEEYTSKDFSKIVSAMLTDIIEEEKEEGHFTALDQSSMKLVTRHLQKEISNTIRPVFIENIKF